MRSDALGLFWEDKPVVKKTKEVIKRTPPERTWEDPSYLPFLDEAKAFKYNLFTDQELFEAGHRHERLVFDIECYPNYFLICFYSLDSHKSIYFEMINDSPLNVQKMQWVAQNFCIIGFYSMNFDLTILSLACAGKNNEQLHWATSQLIVFQERPNQVLKSLKVKKLKVDHIDLIEVAPLFGSLKIYGGRINVGRMQDLPFVPGTVLSQDQITIVRWYCYNDLDCTVQLYNAIKQEIDLRVTMSNENGIDLRSKSDAQIAESVIVNEVSRLNGCRPTRPNIEPGTWYKYDVPQFLFFQTPLMNSVLYTIANTRFYVSEFGNISLPEELKDMVIRIGQSDYTIRIGGLHSKEKKSCHRADDYYLLADVDVESYYPKIILNLGLYPQQLGRNFLRAYKTIVDRRLTAKRNGDKVVSDSLKIVINGSFGKLGSMYSALYAPDLLVQVTLTGQLTLLMLIEQFELNDIHVVSANTDGIVIKCPRHKEDLMTSIVARWEQITNFKMERNDYKALYSRDVNNYLAVKMDNTSKGKGIFSMPEKPSDRLHKNPQGVICFEAVRELVVNGVPTAKTITECTDITKFVSVRTVKGGAVKDGDYLGKAIRWYYAIGEEKNEIIYASNGNRVSKSLGAKPIMQLPQQFPQDINYDWYITETDKILKGIGYFD